MWAHKRRPSKVKLSLQFENTKHSYNSSMLIGKKLILRSFWNFSSGPKKKFKNCNGPTIDFLEMPTPWRTFLSLSETWCEKFWARSFFASKYFQASIGTSSHYKFSFSKMETHSALFLYQCFIFLVLCGMFNCLSDGFKWISGFWSQKWTSYSYSCFDQYHNLSRDFSSHYFSKV